MTWARLDDQFPDHPKVRGLGCFGLALQTAAICYCARYLTDGFLSYSTTGQLVASILSDFTLPDGRVVTPAVTSGMSGFDASDLAWPDLMVTVGLWESVPGGYRVHDYLDYNPDKVKVLKEREKTAGRVARHRQSSNGSSNAVSNAAVTGAPSPSPRKKEKALFVSSPEPPPSPREATEPAPGDYLSAVQRLQAKITAQHGEPA
jgi:hypothetical protein